MKFDSWVGDAVVGWGILSCDERFSAEGRWKGGSLAPSWFLLN